MLGLILVTPRALLTLTALAASLARCGGTIPLDVDVGPVSFDVDAARVTLPPSWRGMSTVPTVACSATLPCDAMAGALTLRCAASRCDPDPATFDLAAQDAIDLGAYVPQWEAVRGELDTLEVASVRFTAAASGYRGPGPAVDVYWGPASATAIGSDGVRRLGRVPALMLDAQGRARGELEADRAGLDAFGAHLLHTSSRFRVFARVAVDLAPGDPLPAGRVAVQLEVTVHAERRVVR